MSYAYDQYLAEHIGNVNKGLNWMLDNLGLKEEKTALEEAMVGFDHDESKYSTEEYDAYDQYFYGGNRSYKVVQDFNYAWLHHIHNNLHHWQYWVLLEDDPESGMPYKALEIPMPYIFEMIADWWSFSWKSGNLFEIFNWYADHRSKQIINPKSKEIVEYILERIWKVLIMQETVAGHDISEIEKQYSRFWAEQDINLLNRDHPSAQVIGKVTDIHETENGLEVTVEHSNVEDTLIHNPTISERAAFWGKDKPPVPTIANQDLEPVRNVIGVMAELGHQNVLTTQEIESQVKHSDISEDDEDLYGVPELKKFPMPDKKHVKSAIRFFNYVDPKYEKELAEAILKKAEEFGLNLESDISVGDENKFKKYLKENN